MGLISNFSIPLRRGIPIARRALAECGAGSADRPCPHILLHSALAVVENSSVILASSPGLGLVSSRIGSGIALAARNPAFQIFTVVVDRASESQERWCITTASDALLREFADRQTVFSLDLDWSEKPLFHACPRCAVVTSATQSHLTAQHKRLLIGPSIQLPEMNKALEGTMP